MQSRQHKDQHNNIKGSIRDRETGLDIAQVVNKGKAAVQIVLWISLMTREKFSHLHTKDQKKLFCESKQLTFTNSTAVLEKSQQ